MIKLLFFLELLVFGKLEINIWFNTQLFLELCILQFSGIDMKISLFKEFFYFICVCVCVCEYVWIQCLRIALEIKREMNYKKKKGDIWS